MWKRCCIKSCQDDFKKGSENRRQLFSFPSDEEAKNMWCDKIGENVTKGRSSRKNLFICDIHFEKNCFHDNPTKIFKDGCEVEVPRKVKRLKKGSVPSTFEVGLSKGKDMHCSKKRRYEERDLSPNSRLRVDNLNHIMSLPHSKTSEYIKMDKETSLQTQIKYSKATLIKEWNARNTALFPNYWGMNSTADGVLFSYVGDMQNMVTRSIFIKEDMTVEIRAHNHVSNFSVLQKVTCLEELRIAMIKIVSLSFCERAWKGLCRNGFYIPNAFSSSKKCKNCQAITRREKSKELRAARRLVLKSKRHKANYRKIKERLSRTTKKIENMHEEIEDLMKKCSSINGGSIIKEISNLPTQQQEVVKTILKYSKLIDKKGMRYTREWILECILLSIKSRKAYLHLRGHAMLPLPTLITLRKYLKNMKPRYGFDPQVFAMLKKKSDAMKPEERRGVLVIDEMQISKSVSFDSDNLSVLGFTDLGEHTPEHQKKQQADHALVFLYQPFRGKWIQNVAAFLSKGAASGEVLSHLVSECIILLENHGFHVDVVTTDGATWNRGMWRHFGLKELEASCKHICSVDETETDTSETRRLWFCSDFSHLVKNFRNFMMAKEEIMTPDGIFKKKHFRAILKCDGGAKCLGLKIAHKLTEDHLDPKFYQKMHVHKALDLFSPNVIAAMKVYRKFDEDLKDCESTIAVITRVNKVITAMTSRSCVDALSSGSASYEAITDFINYLRTWKSTNETNDFVFMSASTYVGFEVTLRTSLEVMKFLTEECKYSFLMTARLNQDALEGMFGMIRGCCGSHDKPDPLLFIQIYRLLSFYSLVKPPKGSNVQGVEIFETLLSAKDSLNESKEEWKTVLDEIIERGENNKQNYDARHAHDYNVFGVNENVLSYFGGFVARKIEKWTSCIQCISSVSKCTGNLPRDEMINTLSKGYLKYPSDDLYNLLFSLERAILQTIGQEQLNFYTFQHIVQNILAESITFVGCKEHNQTLTKTVINYYCVTRTHIICKKHNNVYDGARKEEKKYRKLSKLVGTSRIDENEAHYTDEKENKNKNGKGKKRKADATDSSTAPKNQRKTTPKAKEPKKERVAKEPKKVRAAKEPKKAQPAKKPKKLRAAKEPNKAQPAKKPKTVQAANEPMKVPLVNGQQEMIASQALYKIPVVKKAQKVLTPIEHELNKMQANKGFQKVLIIIRPENVLAAKEQEAYKTLATKGKTKVLESITLQNVLTYKQQVPKTKKVLLTIGSQNVLTVKQQEPKRVVVDKGTKKLLVTAGPEVNEIKNEQRVLRI